MYYNYVYNSWHTNPRHPLYIILFFIRNTEVSSVEKIRKSTFHKIKSTNFIIFVFSKFGRILVKLRWYPRCKPIFYKQMEISNQTLDLNRKLSFLANFKRISKTNPLTVSTSPAYSYLTIKSPNILPKSCVIPCWTKQLPESWFGSSCL